MKMTSDNCRMASINTELQAAVNSFVRDTVANNDIPWYMMKNALMNTLFWVKDEEATEAVQAQNQLYQLMQVSQVQADTDSDESAQNDVDVQEG